MSIRSWPPLFVSPPPISIFVNKMFNKGPYTRTNFPQAYVTHFTEMDYVPPNIKTHDVHVKNHSVLFCTIVDKSKDKSNIRTQHVRGGEGGVVKLKETDTHALTRFTFIMFTV